MVDDEELYKVMAQRDRLIIFAENVVNWTDALALYCPELGGMLRDLWALRDAIKEARNTPTL